MADQNQRFEQLKQKYASVLETVKQEGVRLAHVHVEHDKLFLQGEAPSENAKNRVWDQIKKIDPSYSDLTADITVSETASQAAVSLDNLTSASAGAGALQMYTVQAGDTLSKIAKEIYGDANQYMKIFNANKDQLSDPDKIQKGQTLKIPK